MYEWIGGEFAVPYGVSVRWLYCWSELVMVSMTGRLLCMLCFRWRVSWKSSKVSSTDEEELDEEDMGGMLLTMYARNALMQ